MKINQQFAGVNLSDWEKKEVANCNFEILNPEKFLKYLRTKKKMEDIRFFISSKDEKINLSVAKPTLLKRILHFSEEEQEKIIEKHNIYRSLMTVSTNYFRAATEAKYGRRQKEEENKKEHSLLVERKAELLELFGKMFTVKEVWAMIRDEWQAGDIKEENILSFFRDNSDEINRLREKHKNDYSHLRLTTKTSRLEELTSMFAKMKKKYEYSSSREDHKVLLTTLESIRKEVEGDRMTIEGNMNVNIQQDVNIHIRNEMLKNLSIKEIILGRLSAKLGITPSKLISDMNNSYYAKLNRLINDDQYVDYEDVSYPSQQSYDFDKIAAIQKQKELEKAKQKLVIESQTKESENVKRDAIKEALLEKLKSAGGNFQNTYNNMNKR